MHCVYGIESSVLSYERADLCGIQGRLDWDDESVAQLLTTAEYPIECVSHYCETSDHSSSLHRRIAPGFTETGMVPAESVARLRELGVVIQAASTCADAVAFLAVNQTFHTRTIQIVENRFRELESGYEAAAEMMYGDSTAGRRTMNPEAYAIIRQTFSTTV